MAKPAEQLAAMQQQHQQQLQQQQQEQTRLDKQDLREQMNVELEKIRTANTENIQSVKLTHETMLKLILNQRDETSAAKPKGKWSEKLSEKSYKRIDKFAGGEATWQDWRYDFELLTGALNPQVAAELKEAAKASEPRTMAQIREGFVLHPQDNWEPEIRSRELSEVLILPTTGEAKMLIRDAENGFHAWHILNKAYSRMTLARTLRV